MQKSFHKYFTAECVVFQDDQLEFIVKLVAFFRPKKLKKNETISLQPLLDFLANNEVYKQQIQAYLKNIFKHKSFHRMLADAGILQSTQFISEVKKRFFEKILPHQPEKDSLEYVLNQIFYDSNDARWIETIPQNQLVELFELLEFKDIYSSAKPETPLNEVLTAIGLISQRMSGSVMENDVLHMVPELEKLDSPFVTFEKEFLQIAETIQTSENHYITIDNLDFKQLMVLHNQSKNLIEKAFHNSSKYGITLQVNQSLLRIQQQLERVERLLNFLVITTNDDKLQKTIQLSLQLIKYNCFKNNIRSLIKDSTRLVAYEITQHTGKTGEQYITETKTEYFKMLWAAMGGGFIVGILVIIKLLFSKINTSDFGHAILYSLNYSLGFIAIYLLGFTLATKQPAMTAAAIARSLEEGLKNTITHSSEKYKSFAKLFARLFRSQFIAFVGNVLVAFPVALFIIWLIDYGLAINIAQEKHQKLLTDLSPIDSLAILHASIAGIFLFLSGIISGNVSNKSKFSKFYYRIQENPSLKNNFGRNGARKIAYWFEKNWAGVVSNGWFGVFLGSTASVGLFLGLNLDIRHITFAAGNFAMGLYGAGFQVDFYTIIWAIIGIFFIGLCNFIVSFSLSLFIALRSRNISFTELKLLNTSVWSYFKRKPFRFFLPILDKATPKNL